MVWILPFGSLILFFSPSSAFPFIVFALALVFFILFFGLPQLLFLVVGVMDSGSHAIVVMKADKAGRFWVD